MERENINSLSEILENFNTMTKVPICIVDMLEGILYDSSLGEGTVWTRNLFEYIITKRNRANVLRNMPFISHSSQGLCAGIIVYEDVYVVFGPTLLRSLSLAELMDAYSSEFSHEEILLLCETAVNSTKMDIIAFARSLSLLNRLITGEYISYTAILEKSLRTSEILEMSNEPSNTMEGDDEHKSTISGVVSFENRLEEGISRGSRDVLTKLWMSPSISLGDSMETSKENLIYLQSRFLTIMSRAALSGGASENLVFPMIDTYILRLERNRSIQEKYRILNDASYSFCDLVTNAKNLGAFGALLRKCDKYIEENIEQKITAKDLSILCGVSVRQISRIYSAGYGMSLPEYLIKIRVQKAAKLLRQTGFSISEISLLSGFQSQSYFAKVFKDYYNTSPSDYRNYK